MAPRTYANDVQLSFGPINVRGRLLGIRDRSAAEPGFKYCSPDGKPVEQRYVDEDGNVFEIDQLGRATIDEDGNYVQVDPDAIAAAKESTLPLNHLIFTAHPADQVEQFLYPSGKHQGYVFEPKWRNSKNKVVADPSNIAAYDLIRSVVEQSDCVFVSEANVQNNEGLFRIGMYQGLVCIQRQCVPAELHQFEVDPPDVKPAVLRKAKQLASTMVEDFTFDTYKNRVAERLHALKEADYDPSRVEAMDTPTIIDFEKVLDAFTNQGDK